LPNNSLHENLFIEPVAGYDGIARFRLQATAV